MSDDIEYVLEEPEPIVKPRRSPDENAQAAWDQVLIVSVMLDHMVRDGAHIRITRSPVFSATADHKALMHERFKNWLNRILATAEFVDPE